MQGLSVEFHTAQGTVHAVRDVSWHMDAGEVLAILGESGSGKSVSAAAIMNLIDSPPGYVTAGRALYRGKDLLRLPAEERRRINGRKIAMIFQDTLAHLNPVYSVGWQIGETLRAHGEASPREAHGARRRRCSSGSASPIRSGAPATIRTSSPAASGSG